MGFPLFSILIYLLAATYSIDWLTQLKSLTPQSFLFSCSSEPDENVFWKTANLTLADNGMVQLVFTAVKGLGARSDFFLDHVEIGSCTGTNYTLCKFSIILYSDHFLYTKSLWSLQRSLNPAQ